MLIGTEWRCDWTGNEPGTDTRMIGTKPCECQGCRAHKQLTALRAKLAEVEGVLRSIAVNTCCDKCQEASLVARAALASAGEAQS